MNNNFIICNRKWSLCWFFYLSPSATAKSPVFELNLMRCGFFSLSQILFHEKEIKTGDSLFICLWVDYLYYSDWLLDKSYIRYITYKKKIQFFSVILFTFAIIFFFSLLFYYFGETNVFDN